jgi:hypothetical protein
MFESSANLAGAITFGPTTHVQTILEKKTLKIISLLLLLNHFEIKNKLAN